MIEDLKHIIESLLFVSEAPLSVQKIQTVLDLRRRDVIVDALKQLSDEYETRKGGFYLAEAAGGYQLRSRPENREWIQRLLQSGPARLSKAAMETLAIVAYKQPIIRSDVEYIRGVDCGGVLRMLLERKLIKILGRRDIPGRPMIYGTTPKFLEIFGLRDLKDLPLPKEIMSPEDAEMPEKPQNADSPEEAEPEKAEMDETPETPPDESSGEPAESGILEGFDDSDALLEIDDMLKAVKPEVAEGLFDEEDAGMAGEAGASQENGPAGSAENPEKAEASPESQKTAEKDASDSSDASEQNPEPI